MENPQTELLSVSLNPAGVASLKRLVRLVQWSFSIAIFFCCIEVINAAVQNSYANAEKYRQILPLYLEVKYRFLYVVCAMSLFFIQISFFWRFTRKINRSLQRLDNEEFNRSFELLYRYSTLALASLLLSTLLMLVDVWANYETMSMISRASG